MAIKTISETAFASPSQRRRFLAEAEVIARIHHPHIIPIHAVGEHAGSPVLLARIRRGREPGATPGERPLDGPPGRRAGGGAGAGGPGRPPAPGSSIATSSRATSCSAADGTPKVADFGLAKLLGDDSAHTITGEILGTPSYMAPEQAEGRSREVGPAVDIYALGAILYQALTGRPPFLGASAMETLRLVVSTEVVPPRRQRPDVPRDLETIALKCLEKEPGRRYADAAALADDLRRYLDGRPIAARPVGAAERAWVWCRRRPAVAALTAAVALAVVAGTATVIAVQARANAELRAANRRVEQRYELAVEAIKTFHTGVSEDFLLEQEEFKELRDRLLKSASDFYAKLSDLLGEERDVGSRRALARSNYELADLTRQVGRSEDALAAHRAVLAAREALAADPGADAVATVDVGRSLTAVAGLLGATGQDGRGAGGLPPVGVAAGRPGGCRSGSPGRAGLLPVAARRASSFTKRARPPRRWPPTSWRGPTRRRWPPPEPPTTPAATWRKRSTASAGCWRRRAGQRRRKPSTARPWRSRRSWPTTTPRSPYSAAAWRSHNNFGLLLARTQRPAEAEARVPRGPGDPQGAGQRPPRRHRVPQRPGAEPQQPRHLAVGDGQGGRGGGRVPRRRWRSARSWPTITPPSPYSAAAWRTATSTSATC